MDDDETKMLPPSIAKQLSLLQTEYKACQQHFHERYDPLIHNGKFKMEINKMTQFGFQEVKDSFDSFLKKQGIEFVATYDADDYTDLGYFIPRPFWVYVFKSNQTLVEWKTT